MSRRDLRPATLEEVEGWGQFAWPGGYEIYYVTDDGQTLCQPCALAEAVAGFEQGPVYFGGTAADTDALTICDCCGRVIVEEWEPDFVGDPTSDSSVAGDRR